MDLTGEHHYSLVKGSHTAKSFTLFLTMLVRRLDVVRPDWREDSIFLVDNATIHGTPLVLKVAKQERIPLAYTAPASFSVLQIELVFSKIK